MVLNTPTFPFVIPPIDLNISACQNEVEKASPMQESNKTVNCGPDQRKRGYTHTSPQAQSSKLSFAQTEPGLPPGPTSWP